MSRAHQQMQAIRQWTFVKQQCLRLFRDRCVSAIRRRLSHASMRISVVLAALALPVGAVITLAGIPLVDETYALFFGITQDSGKEDPDGDGLSNYEESLLWTDPWKYDTDRDGWPDFLDENPVSRAYMPWGDPLFTHGGFVIYTWPVWMDLAWSEGGFWITNKPFAWHSPSKQSPASLNLTVDRSAIASNLVLKLDLYDHAKSSLYVDLFNTNLLVTATNLFDNLLQGEEQRFTLTMEIPFARHPDAVGIHLRKEQGSATIYGSQLYIDADLDGLDACQEAQIETSDTGAASPVEHLDEPVWGNTPSPITSPDTSAFQSDNVPLRSDTLTVLPIGETFGMLPLSGGDPDTDGDGMPDAWETLYGLDPYNPDDALEDSDSDGYLNIYEYIHGSDPTDPECIPSPTMVVSSGQSIQGALSAITNDYGIILVEPGVYTGSGNRNLDFGGKRIMLVSEQGDENTIIDAQGAGRGFSFSSGETRRSVLIGFTIKNGNSYVPSEGLYEVSGGGIYISQSSPSILDCIIVSNTASIGGGIFIHEGFPAMLSCLIVSNTTIGSGGGIWIDTASPVISDCDLIGNHTGGSGGGMYIFQSGAAIVLNTRIFNNTAAERGGGVVVDGHLQGGFASPLFQHCHFEGNTAMYGGGMSVKVNANPRIENSWLVSNTGTTLGGGLHFDDNSFPEVFNTVIALNTADYYGAGIVVMGTSTPNIINCVLVNNHVNILGGGIYDISQNSTILRNCVVRDNTASNQSFQANRQIFHTGSNFSVTYSNIEGGWSGAGNIDADPLFTRKGYRLTSGSPNIEAGSTNGAPLLDIDGESRKLSTWKFSGAVKFNWPYAYEYSTATWYYFNVIDTLWVNGLGGEGWKLINESALAHGTSHFNGTGYAYAYTNQSWYYINKNDRQWVVNLSTGEWRLFGMPAETVDIGIDQFVDVNKNGMADIWEMDHFGDLGQQSDADYDADGLTNLQEYEQSTDPTNPDSSGNGFHDGWLFTYGYDPLDPDALDPYLDDDSDGLGNWQEFLLGSNPGSSNTSGNAYTDLEQYEMGYSPLDPMDGTGHDWFLVTGTDAAGVVTANSRSYTVPSGETWVFDVVLHSEEYPDYTGEPGGGSKYNDVLTWALTPSQGQGLSGNIDVNSRHQHWFIAEQQGESLIGFGPVHREDSIAFRAPDQASLEVSITITAKNVSDGILPSTVIIYPHPNPPQENTADETENHDPEYGLTTDPINVINGNVTLTERDLFIPAPGIPLSFGRYYHSHGASGVDSGVGSGWRHTYDLTLSSRPGATYKGIKGDWMVLSSPDGQRHWFREDNGTWLSPPENNLRLVQAGSLFRVESPGGIRHEFNANGILQSITDAFSNTLEFSYVGTWPSQTLSRVEHANGQFLDFASSAGRITGITTPSTNLALSLQYAASGLLTNAVRHVSGTDAPFAYRYDPVHGVLTQRVNAVGHRFDYGYDFDAPDGPRGNAMQLEGQYFAHTLNYTNQGPNRTEVTYDRDGEPQAFVYAYDATRKTISAIYGPGSMDYGTLLARDDNMNVIGETLFDNDLGEYLVTGRQYDSRNNIIAQSIGYNAAPATQRWAFAWHEDLNLPVETTDPDGPVSQWEYANGRVMSERLTAPGETDFVTTYGYTPAGLLAAITNAAGHAVAMDYDSLGNLQRVIPPAGPVVEMEHNNLGHLEKLIMPYGATNRVTTFASDAAGRVTGLTLPDTRSETFAYNPMGNLITHIDTAGRTNRFEYLPAGRLAESIRYLDGQPVGFRTDFDSQFNLLLVTDQLDRNVETYVLDIRDRVVAVTNLEEQVMGVQYGVGDIVHSVTRFDNTVVSNVWDNQARLSEQILPGITNAFTYTPGGRVTSAASDGITVTNTFDGFMRPVGQQTLDVGPQRGVTYAWNTVGRLAGLQSPAGTRSYGYDPAERLTNLVTESGSFAWTYNPYNGMAASMTHAASGIGAAYGFDLTDRLTGIAWSEILPGMSFVMQYSAADMITNIVHASGERRVYVYDSLDRLTGEKHYDAVDTLVYNASYAFDLAGNRTQTVINGVTNTYTLGLGNRLSSWTGGSYGHDAAGNITNITDVSRPDLSLSWNSQYQLTAVATNGTLAESYGHDPLGRRAWTSDGTVTNWHAYDGMHVVADLDDSGTVLRSYTWGPGIDNLLAITVHTGGTTNTYNAITDHLGTVHALADATGDIVESYRFDAWGNVLEVRDAEGLLSKVNGLWSSPLGNRYLFQGREYSWVTGLYNFRARWYDPITGRWLSNDPIGISGGLNQYVAFGNNPVMFRDPSGLFISWGTAAIGAGLNVAGYAIGSWLIGEKVTAGGFAGAATSGFVAGAIVGAFSGDVSALGAAVIGGAAGGIGALGGSVVQQSIDNRSISGISGRQVVRDTALGTLGGSLGGYFTPASSVARSAAVGLGVGTGLTIGDKTVTKIENAADSFKNLIENSDSRRFEKVCP